MVHWLAAEPPKSAQRKVFMSTVEAIENPRSSEEKEKLQPLPLEFSSPQQYMELMVPLVEREAENEMLIRSQYSWSGVHVEWVNAVTIRFALSSIEMKITIGDRVLLECPLPGQDEPWKAAAVVVRLNERITAKLDGNHTPPNVVTGFKIRFEPSVVTKQRMKRALNAFAKKENACAAYLKSCILGRFDESSAVHLKAKPRRSLKINGVNLNESQIEAVNVALTHPLSLIQGPPGTGKTVVSTAIISLLSRRHRVLACAPSNIVVDQLTAQLGKSGVNVVRMVSMAREILDPALEVYTLNYKVRAAVDPKIRELMDKDERGDTLSTEDQKTMEQAIRKEESRILNKAQAVCATCSGAGDWRLWNMRFKSVLIDESTQAIEPECLMSMMHKCEQLILVGDHKQLGPVVTDIEAVKAGLSRSYFERLVELGHQPTRLTVQYRMHPSLSRFPSSMFYDGSLQNSLNVTQRTYYQEDKLDWLWPIINQPMMFWATMGQEEIGTGAKSYLNQAEASNCRQLVSRMISAGVTPSEIGIITPYEAQRNFLRQHLELMGELGPEVYNQIEIESVDAFQGREKGYVILSCVRSNECQGIGFLKDPRRLNVAITRAQHGLIIIGNPRILSHNALWCDLIEFYRSNGCLVQGTLNNLRPYTLPLNKPKKPATNAQELAYGMENVNLNDVDVSYITQLVDR